MTTNIYDLANELERGIRALPEYQTLVEKKAKIDADPEAKDLFSEFTSFQEGLYQAMQAGQMPSQDEQKKMQELGQKIEAFLRPTSKPNKLCLSTSAILKKSSLAP